MKFQPRRFVVEVKRGTSRTAFTSPDTLSQKFSSAEELLFGAKPVPVQPGPMKAKLARPNGRILESLIEPPPPPPPVEDLVERPRRGRKPGSKNKPKVLPLGAPAPLAPAGIPLTRLIEAIPAGRPAFYEDGLDWRDEPAVPAMAEAPEAEPHPAREQGGERSGGAAGRTASRLRDRSSIIKRYVLGTEPRPGQPGYLRARRAARAR